MTNKNNILKLQIRQNIYNYILKHPGLHLRELIRKLKIPEGTLRHHLNYMEKQRIIISNHKDRYTRYYVKFAIGSKEKKIIHFLRQDTPRNIILYLITILGASQIELSKQLEKHPTTIEFHIKKLLNAEIIVPCEVGNGGVYTTFENNCIIQRSPVGKEIIYTIKDPGLIYKLFYKKNYAKILFDKNVVDILNLIVFISPKKFPKKVENSKIVEDRIFNFFFDFFPIPFCS